MYRRFSEKAMAPHSSTVAWKIPWTEEPGRLQSMGLQRVGHDWATSLSLFTCMHWRRKWQPTPVFLPGESQGLWSLVGCIYGVTQSWIQLKQFSSSSILYFSIYGYTLIYHEILKAIPICLPNPYLPKFWFTFLVECVCVGLFHLIENH